MGRLTLPYRSQPPAGVPIDWGNPLTKGLVWGYMPHSRILPATNNRPLVQASPGGWGAIEAGGALPCVSSTVSISGDRTVLLVAKANSAGTKVAFTTSNTAGVAYWLGTGSSLWSMGGILQSNSIKLGVPQVVVAKKTGTTHGIYVDGVLHNTTTTGAADGTGLSVVSFGTSGGFSFDGNVYLCLVFNYSIPDALIARISANPYQIFQTQRRDLFVDSPVAASAALSGTVTSATEANIVSGGRTIILTLTGDTWVTAGATFDGQRQNIINGLTSAQSELLGWNNVVKAAQGVGGVVRTSNTVVTITLDAQATYNITANETITVTIPATALTGAVALVATPTFTITQGVAAFINNILHGAAVAIRGYFA